ncbi:MAG TPA: hypothetical protein VFW11_02600 [Cyclobacteriaceae bacterium]|nr:hypothetical protein [Cyclobacteriaceae bacterium]
MRYLLPCLFILAALSCKKNENIFEAQKRPADESTEAIIFYTLLADSLSAKAIDALRVGDVTGIKVKYLSGRECRYFEYDAEKSLVIRTISQLPFTPYSKYSDTLCRKINDEDLTRLRRTISSTEYENSSSFWNNDSETVDVYECIKSPFRHTLVIDRKSNHILHRIELLG